MPKVKQANQGSTNSTAANLGFERKLWAAADALWNNMDAAEFKHVVFGLIFLKYISSAFEVFLASFHAIIPDPGETGNRTLVPEVGVFLSEDRNE